SSARIFLVTDAPNLVSTQRTAEGLSIGLVVRTISNQFSVNPLDPNSPNFTVTNPDDFSFGQVFFTDPALNSGFNFTITHFDVGPILVGVPGLTPVRDSPA